MAESINPLPEGKRHQMSLILASTSPYRAALLARLGLPFETRAPVCDEDRWKDHGLPPAELAATLARAKAESLADLPPGATVIGGDQVAACGGRILDKPGERERAVEQLSLLAGRTHELHTAICVLRDGERREHRDRTLLHMRGLDRAALERSVDADRPLDCAGAYKLEARGIALFERIESDDHSAITGIPLLALVRILTGFGYRIP